MAEARAEALRRRDIRTWLGPIARAGLLVPETRLVEAPGPLAGLAQGRPPAGYTAFLGRLADAGDALGWPAVLRTSHGAAKHLWRDTCWVEGPERLHRQVSRLAAWSEERGLPSGCWAVRQAVPLSAYLSAYGGCPVGREWRVRVEGAAVLCRHHAWTRRAVELGRPSPGDWVPLWEDCSRLGEMEERALLALSAHAGRALEAAGLGGAWAIDWAMTEDGRWCVIDADDAWASWHEPLCPQHPASWAGGERPPPLPPETFAVEDAEGPEALAAAHLVERCLEEGCEG